MTGIVFSVAAALVLPCTALGQTVAVAPLASPSAEQYQWLGNALAQAISTRVHYQPELSALTLRQVNAAMRHDNISRTDLMEDETAMALGRLLGADLLVVGTYEARWPNIEIWLKTVDPKNKQVKSTHNIRGDLDNIVRLEAQVAEVLAKALGATKPDIQPGAFGTQSLRAWLNTTLAMDVLNWQSLSPRAADPAAPLTLPKEAVESARRRLAAATKFDDAYGEAWAGLGIAQALLGRTQEAWRSFGKATAMGFGHHPTAVLGAYFVRMRQGNFEEAEKILKDAIAQHPGFLHARGYLGELCNHLGRRREALAAFQAYLEIAPDHPWVLAQLGYTKGKMGDHIGAIADTIRAVDMLPNSPSLLLQLASRYIDAGKLIGAEDALRHAMTKYPDKVAIYVRLGYVYLLQDKDELVIPISEKALLLDETPETRRDRGYAHLNLARAYGRKKDLEQAFVHLEAARQAGVLSLAEIEADSRLEKLRGDARYQKLR